MSLQRTISRLAFAGGMFVAAVAAQAQPIWYVDDDNCPGPGSGTEADPFCKIQDGIDAAQPRNIVLVGDGIYTGIGNKNLSFDGKAITVASANGPDTCVIDCQGSGRGFIFVGGEDDSSVVDGMGITNGFVATSGGGILSINGCPTIENCVIWNNYAVDQGGGIYIQAIFGCKNPQMIIRNSDFVGNMAGNSGGGVALGGGTPKIINCNILFNMAMNGGGLEASIGLFDLTHCTIAWNEAGSLGGGILGRGSLANCLVTNNLAWTFGGAMRLTSETTIRNCTVTRNAALGSAQGGISNLSGNTTIANCILWDNGPEGLYDSTGGISVSFNDIEGGWEGEGNIDADPLFVDPDNGDFHLTVDSPCIDAGDPDFIPDPDETDIDVETRVVGPAVDMGADEFHDCDGNGLADVVELLDGSGADCNGNNTVDSCDIDDGTSFDKNDNGIPDECECPADLDGSADVEAADLAELLSSWGACVGCPADFDGNGDVDAADLAELLSAWGPCE